MIDPHRFKLSPNRITVSTVGVPNAMKSFIKDLPQVNLALSLHAPTQELRSKIVPSARGFPIDKLIATADEYLEVTGRTLLVEYVLLSGVNDSTLVAHQLGKLLKGKRVTVNLIPYNSTDVSAQYSAPPKNDIVTFQRVLKEHKIATTIRKEMGPDIAAACGQLVVSKSNEKKSDEKSSEVDIEDILQKKDEMTKENEADCMNNKLAADGRPFGTSTLWPLGHKIKRAKESTSKLAAKNLAISNDTGIMGFRVFNLFVVVACLLVFPLMNYSGLLYHSWLEKYYLW